MGCLHDAHSGIACVRTHVQQHRCDPYRYCPRLFLAHGNHQLGPHTHAAPGVHPGPDIEALVCHPLLPFTHTTQRGPVTHTPRSAVAAG